MTPAEEEIAFYYQLGLTLAEWTNMEARLLDACLRCVASKEELTRNSLAMGFVNIQGFRNKWLFAGAMVTRALADKRTEEWAEVLEKVNGESTKRNYLAHYSVQAFPNNTPGRRWALSPWEKPKNAPDGQPAPESYCVVDLAIMRSEFQAAHARLANFLARVCGDKEPFLKSDERPSDPPTLEQIRRRIHAELGHPQQSARERKLAESAANAAASLQIELPPKAAEEKKNG